MTTDSSNPPEKPDADDKGHGVAVVQKSSGTPDEGPPKTDGRQTDLVPSETTENAAQSTKEGTDVDIPGSSAQPAPGEKPDEPGAAKDGMQLDTATIPDQHLSDDLGFSDNLSTPFMPFLSSATDTQEVNLDLLPQIPRLFRLLDLVSDKSIEKILIDHKSMGAVMNVLREGSYKTISKIDFAALDGVSIKPVGLYGSKSALVDFLLNLQVVDESM
ncbi:hypothetical protein FRB90_004082 [Tulasnella sp. 427]|nr:hypothetical protein FRB90_004082 [Tulasnella sp. 427]